LKVHGGSLKVTINKLKGEQSKGNLERKPVGGLIRREEKENDRK